MRVSEEIPGDEASLNIYLREIRIFFDTMDQLGLRRVNDSVFHDCMSMGWEGIVLDLILTNDDLLVHEYAYKMRDVAEDHPEWFEFGEPEEEIQCDESCRGTVKLIFGEQYREFV